MCNRLKPKQKAIVEFIDANGPATPRQIRKLLGCDIREAYDRLKRLGMAGIVKNIGKPKHPEYQLVQRWQEKIKQPKQQRHPLRTFAARTGRATKFIKFLGVHGHE